MKAIITDRKTKQRTTIDRIISATTRPDYISLCFIDDDGTKDSDVFNLRDAEVRIVADE